MIPRMVSVTGVKEWNEGELRTLEDYLVGEEPLEIRVGDVPLSVTMRTPGHDLELATGFLFTEGLISDRNQVAMTGSTARAERCTDRMAPIACAWIWLPASMLDPKASQRNFYATSSCGVCGKASIDAVRVRTHRASKPGMYRRSRGALPPARSTPRGAAGL